MEHPRLKLLALLICFIIWCGILPAKAAATTALKGDISADGTLTSDDAAILLRYLLGKGELSQEQAAAADLDENKTLNTIDLVMLKQYILTPAAPDDPADNEESSQSEDSTPDDDGEQDVQHADAIEEKGVVHSGYATFYGGGYEGGCAMLDPISKDDYWITAMNLPDWSCARMAGALLEVTGELGTIQVLVTDLLPEGAKGDLDLYVDAFPLIAPAEKGKVPITWKIIPLDTAEDAPVSYKYKVGTSEFWCGVQVRNHRYPIEKLEYLDAETGEFVEIERRNYNYFESQTMGAGPFTFRITDIYGDVIIDENIPLTPDEMQVGHVQFPK